ETCAKDLILPGRQLVLGDDIQFGSWLDDKRLAVFVCDVDQTIRRDWRIAVFAFQPLFPIDVAIFSAVTGSDALHVGHDDEVANDNWRGSVAGAFARCLPQPVRVADIAMAAWTHRIDLATLQTIDDKQTVTGWCDCGLTSADRA